MKKISVFLVGIGIVLIILTSFVGEPHPETRVMIQRGVQIYSIVVLIYVAAVMFVRFHNKKK